jgi:Cys-tRNA(Pro)/Cys-tRNA(Cys) deacylase
MAMAFKKTNAMRMLDTAGIAYDWKEYEYDESDLSGMHVAEAGGLPPGQVFKTLVVRGERRGILVCCVPVDCEVDLKALAQAAGDKRCDMLPLRELLAVTGYVRGGCSPVGMKKSYPTFIDETAVLYDRIAVSAGVRGCQMLVGPEDLARIAGATFEALTM